MIDLEDEWIGSNPSCPECGNACSMLDACVMSVAFLMIIAALTQFHIERPWGQRPFSIVS